MYRHAPSTFAERDVEGVSLWEMAREVGVSATSVYRHFPDKSAVLRALAHEGRIGSLLPSKTPPAARKALPHSLRPVEPMCGLRSPIRPTSG